MILFNYFIPKTLHAALAPHHVDDTAQQSVNKRYVMVD
jgi:hypothetical protein